MIVSRIAQPATTRSARSAPMQGIVERPAMSSPAMRWLTARIDAAGIGGNDEARADRGDSAILDQHGLAAQHAFAVHRNEVGVDEGDAAGGLRSRGEDERETGQPEGEREAEDKVHPLLLAEPAVGRNRARQSRSSSLIPVLLRVWASTVLTMTAQ